LSASLFSVIVGLVLLAGGLFSAPVTEDIGNDLVGLISLESVGEQLDEVTHYSHPTTMSLQGKVEGISSGDLGVKVSDQNSCSSGVFFDHNYTGVIQESLFNLSLGTQYDLNLNYNQDYYTCLYVNGELVDGPQQFRGGQGQVDIEDVNQSGFGTVFVPYTGATDDVDLGSHGFKATGDTNLAKLDVTGSSFLNSIVYIGGATSQIGVTGDEDLLVLVPNSLTINGTISDVNATRAFVDERLFIDGNFMVKRESDSLWFKCGVDDTNSISCFTS